MKLSTLLFAVSTISLLSFAAVKLVSKSASSTAYVKCANNVCTQLSFATTAFDVKGPADTQAAIRDATGNLRLIYINNTCTTPAKFNC